jgi:hypothetical protein
LGADYTGIGNSTAAQTMFGKSVALASNTRYAYEIVAVISATAVAAKTIGYGLGGTAVLSAHAYTAISGDVGTIPAVGTASIMRNRVLSSFATPVVISPSGAAGSTEIRIAGTIDMLSGSSGTVDFQFNYSANGTTVTVGAGGPSANTGSNSVFHSITSIGSSPGATSSVGGQGSGAANIGTSGGLGLANTITGTSVRRCGGGGAGFQATPAGIGADGGGNGVDNGNGISGTANTGSGGGGTRSALTGTQNLQGGTGGSGVIILSYSSFFTINIGAGLTGTTATVGENKVTTFTAGTGTVSWVQ